MILNAHGQSSKPLRERERERQRERERDKETERETERQRERKRERVSLREDDTYVTYFVSIDDLLYDWFGFNQSSIN